MILTAEPEYETTNVPKNPILKQFHDLVSSSNFEKFIMLCIILNIVQMGADHENMSTAFETVLDVSGYFFTIVFLIEATLKLIAY